MIQTYVLEQMVNLTHAPFQLITPEGTLKTGFGMRTVEQTFYEKNPQILKKAIELIKDYPVIFSEKIYYSSSYRTSKKTVIFCW